MSKGKVDEDFDTLMDLLKGSPAGLAAICGIMVSHAELDIISRDPRLSDDPLIALAAVMRHHKLSFTGGIDSYVIIQQGSDLDVIFSEQFITADDIKPEQ